MRRFSGYKLGLGVAQTVSRRKYNFATDDRIKKLKEIRLKKSSDSKCNWAVRAYNDWRDERLLSYNYDYPIWAADLKNLSSLTKENL